MPSLFNAGTRQGVVALGSDKPVGAVGRDQARLNRPSSTFVRAPPLMLSGNQSILPLVFDGVARMACWAGSVGW